MRFHVGGHRYLGFFPPYRDLEVLDHPYQIPRSPFPNRGGVLLWNLNPDELAKGGRSVRARPPGVALFILLPPMRELRTMDALHQLMARCRPHSILPYVEDLDSEELVFILRRFPNDFAVEVTEYLSWRGLELDLDTRRLLRKTFELSGELRTVSALARALYLSRRALGRRFLTRGLPVPSHWLHFGRILRGSIRLQNPESNLFSIGCDLGYPDGFAFSNQMKRLTGLRPSIMRECFGWEWIVESWLRQEARDGQLAPPLIEKLFPDEREETHLPASVVGGSSFTDRKPTLQVAEDRIGRNHHHSNADNGSERRK